MQTFTLTLDPTNWQEVLQGAYAIAFDIVRANADVEIYFTETNSNPGSETPGNKVLSWPNSWDFQAIGLEQPGQYIWVRGIGDIRGVR